MIVNSGKKILNKGGGGTIKMDNPEKLATQGTQDDEKQNKNNTICVRYHYTQTNTNNVNKTKIILTQAQVTLASYFLFF